MGKDHHIEDKVFGITQSPTPTSFNSITLSPTPTEFTLSPTPTFFTSTTLSPTPANFNPGTQTSAPTVDSAAWTVGDTAIVVSLAVVIAIGIIAYLYFADSKAKTVEPATSENTALLAEQQSSSTSTPSKSKTAKSTVTDHDDEPLEP